MVVGGGEEGGPVPGLGLGGVTHCVIHTVIHTVYKGCIMDRGSCVFDIFPLPGALAGPLSQH